MAPIIADIINRSIALSAVPASLKEAWVTPILKKPSLDPENFKNFRPISNLPFLAKTLEKVVSSQLQDHVKTYSLHDKFQSAYRPAHSTETAMLRITNDLLLAADDEQVGCLVLLDLSAAFDTIDHRILLQKLSSRLHLSKSAVHWFASYLEDRYQKVVIGDETSSNFKLQYGVPQGSVLGPLLFTLYTADLGEIIKKHGLNYHMYADDTQLYISFSLTDAETFMQRLEACIRDIDIWMVKNRLKQNGEKTEVLYTYKAGFSSKHSLRPLQIGGMNILPAENVKSLGVTLDSCLTLNKHVSAVCSAASLHIRNIGKIRHLLTQSTTEKLVHAFITARLDYCNSILYGLPKRLIQRLQRIQNTAARLVTRTNRDDHITPVLKGLHWLPVQERIMFKILLLTYKTIHGSAPSYLSELVSSYTPSRSLRSSSKNLLCRRKTKLLQYGGRSFFSAAPKLWNELPDSVRKCESLDVFKSALKKHLFCNAYL